MTPLGAAARACLGAGCAALIGFACGRAATQAPAAPPAPSVDDAADGVIAQLSSDVGAYLGATYGGAAYGDASYGGITTGRATMYGNFELPEEQVRRWRAPVRPYQTGYSIRESGPTGAITGTVRWRNAPDTRARRCDATPIVGAAGELAEAVVFLEDITTGRQTLRGLTSGGGQWRRLQIGGTVIARDCGTVPRLQLIAPLGATLHLSRAGGPPALLAVPADGGGTAPVFRVELPSAGAEREVELELPGIYGLRAAVDTPPLGWLVVQGHPYYAMTDERGRFRLDAVPPGTYRLRVWAPPLDPASPDGTRSRPRELSRTVTVRGGGVATLALSF